LIILIILGEEYKLWSSSLISCHFISLRSKYSPQHPVLKHPHAVFIECILLHIWIKFYNVTVPSNATHRVFVTLKLIYYHHYMFWPLFRLSSGEYNHNKFRPRTV
jgi:hypothetical protein